MSALNRKLLRDLWRLKSQALAISLVIAGGISMYVMMLGMMGALENTRDIYYERYRFADLFAGVTRAPEGIAKRIGRIAGVKTVETRIVAAAIIDVPGFDTPVTGRLISIPDGEQPRLNRLVLRQGRFPEPWRDREVLVGETFAEGLEIGPGDAFLATINGHRRELTITGVVLSPEYLYTLGPGDLVPNSKSFGVVWMNRSALAAAYDRGGAFNSVTLALQRGANEKEVIRKLDLILEPYGAIGAYGRDDQLSNAFLDAEMKQLKIFGSILPPIFLGVAAFLLSVVLTRLVDTEREQIGLLKAFGYRDWTVAWHYLKFGLAISALGILVGIITGTWMAHRLAAFYTEFFRFPFLYFSLEAGLIATTALTGFGITVLASLGSVRRAARLRPAVAMVPPAPPAYRRTGGLLGRFGAGLDQPTRMILRHVVRWPARSFLTVFGIAMAAALLISASFALDSIRRIIDVHFFVSERQDVLVTFNQEVNKEVMTELKHLPGVLQVEPFRAVAVELSHGPRVERQTVMGLPPGANLHRLIDTDLRPVSMPNEGLVLTSILAKNLDAGRGDILNVRVKEGRRPTLDIRVAAVVEQYLGALAYADISFVNRLMKEGPMISGVRINADTEQLPDLYRRLKDTPRVAGVGLREESLQSFRDTIEETIDIQNFYSIFFAGLIAFGVIYNSARISLSERGRELGSLRVLGFSHGEVAYVLLGELGLLTLIALPIGCLLGYGLAAWIIASFESDLYHMPLVIEPSTYGRAMLVVVVFALFSGAIVMRRLARLDLVAVLKTRE